MKKYISICVFALLLVFLAAPSISSAQTTVRCVSASGGAMGPVGGSAPVAGNQCDTTTGSIGTGSGTCQYQNSDLLMCVPPPSLCTDTNASNYNQPLPCTYPKLCTDTNASNYNQPLPCTYPKLCTDPSALNNGYSLPCTFPITSLILKANGNSGSTTIASGDTVILSSTASGFNTSVGGTASGDWIGTRVCSTITYAPLPLINNTSGPIIKNYTLTCGASVSSVYVTVKPTPILIPALSTCMDSTASNYKSSIAGPCIFPVLAPAPIPTPTPTPSPTFVPLPKIKYTVCNPTQPDPTKPGVVCGKFTVWKVYKKVPGPAPVFHFALHQTIIGVGVATQTFDLTGIAPLDHKTFNVYLYPYASYYVEETGATPTVSFNTSINIGTPSPLGPLVPYSTPTPTFYFALHSAIPIAVTYTNKKAPLPSAHAPQSPYSECTGSSCATLNVYTKVPGSNQVFNFDLSYGSSLPKHFTLDENSSTTATPDHMSFNVFSNMQYTLRETPISGINGYTTSIRLGTPTTLIGSPIVPISGQPGAIHVTVASGTSSFTFINTKWTIGPATSASNQVQRIAFQSTPCTPNVDCGKIIIKSSTNIVGTHSSSYYQPLSGDWNTFFKFNLTGAVIPSPYYFTLNLHTDHKDFGNLQPGTYNINEDLFSNTGTVPITPSKSLSCVSSLGNPVTASTTGNATVNLSSNEIVTCTFINVLTI